MSEPDRYAVFGYPIHHSKSPQIHTEFARQTSQNMRYSAQEVRPENFDTAVDEFFSNGGRGINCTVPLKELAFRRADHLSEHAQHSGAVNTLKIDDDGRLFGDNTDGIGLIRDLCKNLKLTLANQRILLLGAGGASRGIIAPLLAQAPKTLHIANRTESKAQQLSDHFSELGSISASGLTALEHQQPFNLIINATAASLSNDLPPLPGHLLSKDGACYDLAYSDIHTPFVQWGIDHQASVSADGLGMLVEQAAEAFHIWRGVRPKTAEIMQMLRPS